MDTTSDRLELTRQAMAGDIVALKLLLTESHERLTRYLRAKIPADLRATLDAEDVLQEAYVRVFTHIWDFVPGDGQSFDRWVTTIAVRRLRSAIRRQRAFRRSGHGPAAPTGGASPEDSVVALLDLLASPQHSPSRSVARREAVASVKHEILTLPAHYRQAIELVYLQGRTVAAAAHEMGRTPRAIHGLCRRGTRLLAQRLGSASSYLNSKD
jgi:RNA polymerase sigma-70 factor (ECF subfamily)